MINVNRVRLDLTPAYAHASLLQETFSSHERQSIEAAALQCTAHSSWHFSLDVIPQPSTKPAA